MSTHSFREEILPVLAGLKAQEKAFALVTLVAIEGSSPRPLGSQMLVTREGDSWGQISGGCCEKAIVAEAQDSLEQGRGQILRYGQGSPFLDITLPCGSSLLVRIDVNLSDELIDRMLNSWQARQAFAVRYSRCEADLLPQFLGIDKLEEIEAQNHAFKGEHCDRIYWPRPQLFLFGEGAILLAMIELAKMLELTVVAVCSEAESLRQSQASIEWLDPVDSAGLAKRLDQNSALVTLYHDHQREDEALAMALRSPAFYIGALGSRKAHQSRCERLQRSGFSPQQLQRIHGPAGIHLPSKSPPQIALAIITEMLQIQRRES